jgi:pyrimidine operon attenuation protein/uracil phosphoribosyltransferase
MAKINILNSELLNITISRLSRQLIENHNDFTQSVILGLQPRGAFVADRIRARLKEMCGIEVQTGYLDTTFYRDDFRRGEHHAASSNKIPFLLENKKIILADDVLYTGRSVRAALSAMMDFGRPQKVELLALIDRKYSRDLPIEANYVGKTVNTIQAQKVIVEWKEQGFESDNIWLVNRSEINRSEI